MSRIIPVETTEGIKQETVYEPTEHFYNEYLYAPLCVKNKIKYLNVACAFDIETTNMVERDAEENITSAYSFMYHWQFCIDDKVCFGTTWEEFLNFIDDLKWNLQLNRKKRLVVYVHNLSFEFQFMRRFINVSESFFRGARDPLKFLCNGAIEFRDSYALSNMSLAKFCENSRGVTHYKLADTYDYNKIRTPDTPATESEEMYDYNDVRGLCECIKDKMQEDDLAHIPLTSTGYVRRDFRKSYAKNKRNRQQFRENQLTPELYNICKSAFRGGDTHANVRWADQVLHDIHSHDLTSSYPAAEMLDKYPVGAFFRITPSEFFNMDTSEYAKLIHLRLTDVRYVGTCGIPYIAEARVMIGNRRTATIDNGRVLYADLIDMWITDVDYKIIMHEYQYNDLYVKEVWGARYGELPAEFKNTLMGYYRAKTELKGLQGREYEYMKSKNKLNASYGMMVTDIAKPEIEYINGEYVKKELVLQDALEKYYKSRNNFLSYQQGIWVTANARYRLRKMLWEVGNDVVYVDTDSIKYRNPEHIEKFNLANEENHKLCEKYGAFAERKDGSISYMGDWDYEGCYSEFKTLGAKKYIVKEEGVYKSTIAGVAKKAGRKFFNENGIDSFAIGTVIPDSGHLVAYYNDDEEHKITVNGCTFTTAANVALVNDRYTIGVTNEYLDLLYKALAGAANLC